jgi:hypothetical protein
MMTAKWVHVSRAPTLAPPELEAQWRHVRVVYTKYTKYMIAYTAVYVHRACGVESCIAPPPPQLAWG